MQTLIPGCETPLLAAIDPGSSGALVKNDFDGNLIYIKNPNDGSGTDLLAVRDFLQGCDMVIMEHPPLGGFGGHTSLSENGCFQQYKELYGLLTGAGIPFYTIRPRAWMDLMSFPKKGKTPDKEWKAFLHDQALSRHPGLKIPLYAADGFLLHKVISMLWYKDKSQWP